ncbi:MAG: hypothetical protein AAFV19_00885 [Pseudomonadota bacterium]
MRAAGLITAALLALPAFAAGDMPPDGAAWGCSAAAFFDPVTVKGLDAPAFRALYTSFYVDGPESEIAETVVHPPAGMVFVGDQPFCADVNRDGAPDPLVVIRGDDTSDLVAYVKGEAGAPLMEAGIGGAMITPIGIVDISGVTDLAIAVIRSDPQTSLTVIGFEDGAPVTVYTAGGFATPVGRDPRIIEFVRDCGQGREIVLPSAGWKTLDVVRATAEGLERATLAQNPDFYRLVRALECKTE